MDIDRQLRGRLADSALHIAGLELELARTLEASESSNADDEHDPEGATVAFERQQMVALLRQARRSRADLEQALTQFDRGTYGACVACGAPIGSERLTARPEAQTCIACARRSSATRP